MTGTQKNAMNAQTLNRVKIFENEVKQKTP
jgi:hypothetical protein